MAGDTEAVDERVVPSVTHPRQTEHPSVDRRWSAALIHGGVIALVVLAWMGYWFAVADRYRVFLYFHVMGALYPDTSPFSAVTISRYWMTGPVAGGGILVLYSATNWLAGRLITGYRPPPWQRVWLVAALSVGFTLPVLVMTQNHPPMPALIAGRVTGATLIALVFAIVPGDWAATRPSQLLWLAAQGMGVALLLQTAIHIPRMGIWLQQDRGAWVVVVIGGLCVGVAWLWMLNVVHRQRGAPKTDTRLQLAAGFCIAYLLLPLLHHLVGTDGYFYITDSDNFFARTVAAQLAAWGATAGAVWLVNRAST